MGLASRRIGEVIALAAIGDGAMAMLRPRGHTALWQGGPAWLDRMMEPFARRPGMTRALGAANMLFGIWLANKVENRTEQA